MSSLHPPVEQQKLSAADLCGAEVHISLIYYCFPSPKGPLALLIKGDVITWHANVPVPPPSVTPCISTLIRQQEREKNTERGREAGSCLGWRQKERQREAGREAGSCLGWRQREGKESTAVQQPKTEK